MFTTVVWFYVVCGAAYLIDEMVPKLSTCDSQSSIWFWFTVELLVMVPVYHIAIYLLKIIHSIIFSKMPASSSMPEMWGTVAVVFAIITFQKSLQRRAQKLFGGIFDHLHKYEQWD